MEAKCKMDSAPQKNAPGRVNLRARAELDLLHCRRGGLRGGGFTEVADDAGGLPDVGEAGAGIGFAEAQDEAVHFAE